jgi:hypothetical protein
MVNYVILALNHLRMHIKHPYINIYKNCTHHLLQNSEHAEAGYLYTS